MKAIRLAPLALLAGTLAGCAAYAQAPGYGARPGTQPPYQDDRRYGDDRYYDERRSPRLEVGFFYDELSPYGDWVMTPDYGWAWFPRDVHSYWRPYTDGRWVNTEYGWTWASDEPFGWATYHYGRWAWDPHYGWLWVPGTIWGPAWVSWQHGGGYVGWAPLPPSVGFEIGIGLRLGGLDLSIGIRPDHYRFVPERSFLEPRLSGYMVPTARNVTIIHNTTNITNYTYIDNRVVNRGVDLGRIERVTGRRAQRLRVAESRTRNRTEVAQSEVRIYRPEKQKLDTVRVGPRANAGRKAEAPAADRDRDRPSAERRNAPEIVVAPRARPAPQADTRQFDKQERREKQELQRYQADEKRKVERLQQQEAVKARAQAERDQVVKRHQAEREALQQEQRDAAQQLEARQKAKRQAVQASPPGKATPEGEKKAVDPKKDKKKPKAKPQQDDKGRAKDKKPNSSPPDQG